MNLFEVKRNSVMEVGEVYFWTATIKNWNPLLAEDVYKQIIIDSLIYLSNKKLISVYGFVIMPNHLHALWEMNAMNGKEKPYASFLKYTAHNFKNQLLKTAISSLNKYTVTEPTRKHRFWKRDPLAVKILSREMMEQKLLYCHSNPLQGHWNLAKATEEYFYSSAFDYENNFSRFNFLNHYINRV